MIPKFPNFKRLELSDKSYIDNFTSKYEPYSDFSFVDMWAWDSDHKIELSDLNDNLVIKTKEYFSDNYSYSFLGQNNVTNTVDQLFSLLKESKTPDPQLILVPEVSLSGLNTNNYYIEIDLNSYDYIYNLEDLSVYPGSKFSDKRRKINTFFRTHKNYSARLIDIHDSEIKKQILGLNEIWNDNKSKPDEGFFLPKEHVAINSFLKADFEGVMCMGVYVEDRLIGYSTFTILTNDYAICHFSKADITSYGVYEYMMRETASILLGHKVKYLNYQEDLGLAGLRFFKNSFSPIKFLRKYYIKSF